MSTAGKDRPRALAEDESVPANPGTVVSVRGSVVNVRFAGHLPPIYSVLRAGDEQQIVIEVLAQRDAAMERADRNIDESLEDLNGNFHRLRQSGIDAELFGVISGFEALAGPWQHAKRVAIHSAWNRPEASTA